MANIPDSKFDLSSAAATSWRGLRPGLTRAEVLALLPVEMAEEADDKDDPDWMIIGEWEMDLTFAPEDEKVLRQIVTGDAAFHWRGRPLIGEPLSPVLGTLGDGARVAVWRYENALEESIEDWQRLEPRSVTDKALLEAGVLWLPTLQLGLELKHNAVARIAWRAPGDLPRQTLGGITDAQLEHSQHPGASGLPPLMPTHSWVVWLQLLLTAALISSMACFVIFGQREQRCWQAASQKTATVTAIDPQTSSRWQTPYHLAFDDADGVRRTVSLPAGEFYVPPRMVGEEIQVVYLPTDPSNVKGPAYPRDAALHRFLPWAIGALVIYGVLRWLVRLFANPRNNQAAITSF